MPFQKMFWGAMYGSFADKYGVQWIINFSLEQRPLEAGSQAGMSPGATTSDHITKSGNVHGRSGH